MLYLHVIDTHDNSIPTKSMFVEDVDAFKIAKLISQNEADNIVIVNSVGIDKKQKHTRKMEILYVFLNGKEDSLYSEKLKVNKKNN